MLHCRYAAASVKNTIRSRVCGGDCNTAAKSCGAGLSRVAARLATSNPTVVAEGDCSSDPGRCNTALSPKRPYSRYFVGKDAQSGRIHALRKARILRVLPDEEVEDIQDRRIVVDRAAGLDASQGTEDRSPPRRHPAPPFGR